MKNVLLRLLMLLLIVGLFSCEDDEDLTIVCAEEINALELNQIQLMGSHNSYRLRPHDQMMFFLENAGDLLPEGFDPGSWDYTHEPLDVQFNTYGVRSIEIDVFRDPDGGRFYHRQGNPFAGLEAESFEPKLQEPGLKILHFPDFDYRSNYLTFKEALETLDNWSDSHPTHLPMIVLVQALDDSPGDLLPGYGLTHALPFDAEGLEEIETEIEAVFGVGSPQIFTPRDLKGSYTTLNDAVKAKSWPTVGEMRGKVIFLLFGREDMMQVYSEGFPSLDGRLMFVLEEASGDFASSDGSVFLKIDNPELYMTKIQGKITEGYFVRTRADANTIEARSGYTARMLAAIESGAQVISTDYYKADARAGTDPGWSNYAFTFANAELAIVQETFNIDDLIECTITE